MKQLWNRQNKLNKFIAFCLALVLAVVPLMTYVGDKEGAKAEGGSLLYLSIILHLRKIQIVMEKDLTWMLTHRENII